MDISASQYNSSSESGWTNYLDQSTFSENHFQRRNGIADYEGKGEIMEESEEDLSMVSDASSGPQHCDDECYCENLYPYKYYTKESQKKVKEYSRRIQHQPSTLDDTASSSLFKCPKESQKNLVKFLGNGAMENELDFSQRLSATKIKRKAKIQKHFRGKQASQEPDGFNEEQRM